MQKIDQQYCQAIMDDLLLGLHMSLINGGNSSMPLEDHLTDFPMLL